MATSEPVQINSYIILDLETTGLPQLNIKTKITEISLLGLHRTQILLANKSNDFIPRVVQKLNLCIYPKKFINTAASEVSGLTNEILQNCKTFADVFDIILYMIDLMPPPVCMLAHNGNRFDFPIFHSEIAHIGKKLPDYIYCADTLPAFRVFVYKNLSSYENVHDNDHDEVELIDEEPPLIDSDETDLGIVLNDNDDCNQSNHWDGTLNDDVLNSAAEVAELQYIKEMKEISLDGIIKINETTPKRRTNRASSTSVKPSSSGDHLSNSGNKKKGNVSKKLFTVNNKNGTKYSYKLKNCYEYLTGKSIINQHRADSDTHALLECVVAIGLPILEWFDNNCKPFNNTKKLW